MSYVIIAVALLLIILGIRGTYGSVLSAMNISMASTSVPTNVNVHGAAGGQYLA
jgi:hypothetical protein